MRDANEKAPEAAVTALEGSITYERQPDMTTVSLAPDASAVRAYVEEIRDLMREHATPIRSIADPRFSALGEKYRDLENVDLDHRMGEMLAWDWFWSVFDEKPGFPWDGPGWSTGTPRYIQGGYHEVVIEFEREVAVEGAVVSAAAEVWLDFDTAGFVASEVIHVTTDRMRGESDFLGTFEEARAHLAALTAILAVVEVE